MILNYSNCVTPISSPFCFNGTVDSEADEDQSSLRDTVWFLLREVPMISLELVSLCRQ